MKKTCYHRKAGRFYIALCDSGGSLKMLAQAQSSERIKPGDLLSSLKNVQYCINRDISQAIKIIDTGQYVYDGRERPLRLSKDK